MCLALIRKGDQGRARQLAANNRAAIAVMERSQGGGELHLVLGELAFADEDIAATLDEIDQSLRIFRAMGIKESVPWVFVLLARALHRQGESEQGALVLGIEAGWGERASFNHLSGDQAVVDAVADELRTVLGDERFDEQLAAGRALDDDGAYATALEMAGG